MVARAAQRVNKRQKKWGKKTDISSMSGSATHDKVSGVCVVGVRHAKRPAKAVRSI